MTSGAIQLRSYPMCVYPMLIFQRFSLSVCGWAYVVYPNRLVGANAAGTNLFLQADSSVPSCCRPIESHFEVHLALGDEARPASGALLRSRRIGAVSHPVLVS